MSAPQQFAELWHAAPLGEQLPAAPQTPPLQKSEPQQDDAEVHDPPCPTQPLAPVQTPEEQVSVPQQSPPLEQRVPSLWQLPELQT